MQKITIDIFGEKNFHESKIYIGQRIYVINYNIPLKPVILEGYVLGIGIETIYQPHELIYFVDKSLSDEKFGIYYKDQVFASKKLALRNIISQMRNRAKDLQDKLKLIRE